MYGKIWRSYLEKVSFKSTNIICVVQGTIRTGSKNVYFSPFTAIPFLSELSSHGVHQKWWLSLSMAPPYGGFEVKHESG